MNNKYPYLDIDEEALIKGLVQIEKICNIINNKPYLTCRDCPFDNYCVQGGLSLIETHGEEITDLLDNLSKINEKIKSDKMTF